MKSPKAIALVTTALFVASLFWLLNTRNVNSSLEAGLKEQKLRSEQLLSEKLLLEKDIEKIKEQLFDLKDKNLDLNTLVKNAEQKLKAQEATYDRMKKENASLAQIKKQRQELLALQNQLENELQSLRTAYASLEETNRGLSNTVASLEEKNRLLTSDLNRAMFASMDQGQIQAVKRDPQRLTVKAKRTKRLIANFEVPANLANLSFRIKDTNGNIFKHDDGVITSKIQPSDQNYTASTDSNIDAGSNKLQHVEMVFIPNKKLKSGSYTVEILNDNLYVGSLKVKLN